MGSIYSYWSWSWWVPNSRHTYLHPSLLSLFRRACLYGYFEDLSFHCTFWMGFTKSVYILMKVKSSFWVAANCWPSYRPLWCWDNDPVLILFAFDSEKEPKRRRKSEHKPRKFLTAITKNPDIRRYYWRAVEWITTGNQKRTANNRE